VEQADESSCLIVQAKIFVVVVAVMDCSNIVIVWITFISRCASAPAPGERSASVTAAARRACRATVG
jgi:hypothetical protein